MKTNQTRRSLLRSGVMAGAGTVVALGLGAKAFADSRWGWGVAPGQTLPPEAANGPWNKLRAVRGKKVFDIHIHSYETPKQGNNYATEGAEHYRDVWTNYTDELIASMDRYGIAMGALNPAFTTFEEVVKTSYLPHKDRFVLSAGLPTAKTKPLPAGSLSPEDIAAIYEEQLTQYGAKFIGETAGSFALWQLMPKYSMKQLKPFADVMLKHDIPIQIHTGWSPTGRSTASVYDTANEWAAQLGKFMSAYPEIKLIMAHEGGQFPQLDGWEAIRLLYSFDNVYADTAKSPPEIITAAVRGIGAERVIFGSDWNRPQLKEYGPFFLRAAYQQWWNLNNVAMADISEDERDWVLYKSAHKLLKLG
jgi:hypothetical protein